ncbi:MAG: TetR/AcrR family transcriptional regulator [Bacteroidota bacterium]
MRARDESKESTIRQKAMEMIVAQGFDGLSMQKLAKAAGVSPATIYIYFKDREDLIMQLCKEVGERIVEKTLLNFDPGMSFEDGLRVQWKNRASYWISNPVESQFLEMVKHTHYYDKFGPQVKNAFSAVMGTFIGNAIRNGEMKLMSKEVYWSICFAPLYQLVKYHISGKGLAGTDNFVLTDAIMEEAFQLVLKALKA